MSSVKDLEALKAMVKEVAETMQIPPPREISIDEIDAINARVNPKKRDLEVNQGALDQLTDEGLRGLIGHELGHLNQRTKKILYILAATSSMTPFMATPFVSGAGLSAMGVHGTVAEISILGVSAAANLALFASAKLAFGKAAQHLEYDADKQSATALGPEGTVGFLEKIDKQDRELLEKIDRFETILRSSQGKPEEKTRIEKIRETFRDAMEKATSTHPPTEKRIAKIEKRFGKPGSPAIG